MNNQYKIKQYTHGINSLYLFYSSSPFAIKLAIIIQSAI